MLIEIGLRLLPLAVVLCCGAGLARVLRIPVRSWSRGLATAFLLGVAWIGICLMVLSHCLGTAINTPLVVVLAGIPVLPGLAMQLRERPTARVPCPATTTKLSRRVLGVTLGFVSAGLFVEAAAQPLADWDGRMTWSTEARYVAAARSVDAPVLADDRWFISHPRYPPLMPLLQVAAIDLGRGSEAWEERCFRPIYACFLPALVLLIFETSRRFIGTVAASATALLALGVPFFSFGREGGAISAYSDLPLACFLGGGLALLLRARPQIGQAIAAGLLLAGAMLTKNEGTPLALLALALAGAWNLRPAVRRRRRTLFSLAAATLLVLGALLLLQDWRRGIPNRYDEDYPALVREHPTPVLQALERQPALLGFAVRRMVQLERWGLLWFVVPVLIVAGAKGLKRRQAWFFLVAAIGPPLLGWAAYCIHSDPQYLASVTWDRFLLQAAPPLFIWLGFALATVLEDVRGMFRETVPAGFGASSDSR
jgi:hypothetical protein